MSKADKLFVLGLCTSVFIMKYGYLLAAEHIFIKPFHLWASEQVISRQAHYDYIFDIIGLLILVYLLSRYIPALREELFVFWCFWWGYLFEYVLVYNQPFAKLWFMPISFSLILGLGMISIVCVTIFKKS